MGCEADPRKRHPPWVCPHQHSRCPKPPDDKQTSMSQRRLSFTHSSADICPNTVPDLGFDVHPGSAAQGSSPQRLQGECANHYATRLTASIRTPLKPSPQTSSTLTCPLSPQLPVDQDPKPLFPEPPDLECQACTQASPPPSLRHSYEPGCSAEAWKHLDTLTP